MRTLKISGAVGGLVSTGAESYLGIQTGLCCGNQGDAQADVRTTAGINVVVKARIDVGAGVQCDVTADADVDVAAEVRMGMGRSDVRV
jgi:hypothetical protein